jgi:hypothetical protein
LPQIELQNGLLSVHDVEQPSDFAINSDGTRSQYINPLHIQKSWFDEMANSPPPPGLVEPFLELNMLDSTARGPMVPPALQEPTQYLPETPTRRTRTGQRSSGSRAKISDEAKEILLDWYNEKKYITKNDQDLLATLTKLSPKTVKTWFDNRRTREARGTRNKSCGKWAA